MKIPLEIKVGGINYQVELVDHIVYEGEGFRWGECNYQEAKISIWKELSEQKRLQTFIHELTHAVFHESGIDDQDEDQVNRVGLVLHEVLLENKLL